MTERAHAYLLDRTWRIVPEPPCVVLGVESWPSHPWAVVDPPTYQDCPRCGMRRMVIPGALRQAAARAMLPPPP